MSCHPYPTCWPASPSSRTEPRGLRSGRLAPRPERRSSRMRPGTWRPPSWTPGPCLDAPCSPRSRLPERPASRAPSSSPSRRTSSLHMPGPAARQWSPTSRQPSPPRLDSRSLMPALPTTLRIQSTGSEPSDRPTIPASRPTVVTEAASPTMEAAVRVSRPPSEQALAC